MWGDDPVTLTYNNIQNEEQGLGKVPYALPPPRQWLGGASTGTDLGENLYELSIYGLNSFSPPIYFNFNSPAAVIYIFKNKHPSCAYITNTTLAILP